MRRRMYERAHRHYTQAREEGQSVEHLRFFAEQMNTALNNLVDELTRPESALPVAERCTR